MRDSNSADAFLACCKRVKELETLICTGSSEAALDAAVGISQTATDLVACLARELAEKAAAERKAGR